MKKFLVFLAFLTAAVPAWSAPLKIVALVNNEIISSEDFQNRVNAFLMTMQIPLNGQTQKMIMQRVLNAAVDEKIKLQEADKYGIKVSDKEIREAYRNFE